MKRFAVVFVMALVIGGLALAADTTVLKVKVATANVRTEPDINAAVVKQLAAGTLLEADKMVGDWWEISVTDSTGASITGYIHANVVDVISGGNQPTPEETQPVPKAQPARTNAPAYNPGYAVAPSAPGGFKIMAGYGMASLKSSSTSSSTLDTYKKSLSGLVGGVGFETGGTVGLEIDVMYLPKGVRYQGTDSGTTFDVKERITEISAPVLLKFNLPVQGVNPFLLGGGEIGYVVQAKYDYTYTSGGTTNTGSTDLKDSVNKIDYGLVLGGGVGIPLGGMNFVGELRYHLGLANLNKTTATDTTKVTSSMFLILVGLKF